MENVINLLRDMMSQGTLAVITLSNLRRKDPEGYSKVKVKPVQLKGGIQYQFTYQYEQKVRHENRTAEETLEQIGEFLKERFKQALVQGTEHDVQVLVNKKGQASILKQAGSKTQVDVSHNRKKQYLLEEGIPVPYLVELGVMNPQGKVLAPKYDKFRQINRFLEMVEDTVPHLPKDRTVQIVDFGCGKSYLTFALYHYLKEIRKLDIRVVGLDLKADVIEHCSQLACRFGYKELSFLVGDIGKYQGLEGADMVVTLHACNMATDAALEKAVRWGAGVILSVPCCQHELYGQVESDTLAPMLRHGIIKERFAALATDSVRAQLLDLCGYRTQLLEFIDMEHTPKNLLIRAVKETRSTEEAAKLRASYLGFKQALQIQPALERLLQDVLGLE